MYVLTLPVLRKMLHTAAVDLKDNVQYLCELDSVAGDGDHGIAIGHIADILKSHSDDTTIATMNLLLEGIGDAFMGVNAGSSGPLWGTIFAGMADGIDDQQELTEIEFKRMFAQAKEDFMDVSKAKVGDKTLVDAFYPAVSAIAETEGSSAAPKTLANAASAIKTRALYPWQFSLPGLPKAQEHSSLKSGGFLKINYALMEVVNNEKIYQ